MANAALNSGGVVSRPNTAESGSPSANAPMASLIRAQIDISK
jgi:hypothetical protein